MFQNGNTKTRLSVISTIVCVPAPRNFEKCLRGKQPNRKDRTCPIIYVHVLHRRCNAGWVRFLRQGQTSTGAVRHPQLASLLLM